MVLTFTSVKSEIIFFCFQIAKFNIKPMHIRYTVI